jgi:DNA-binding protein HU-beta
MNKSQLIDSIAENADIPKTVAAKALDGFMAAVQDALVAGDTITLVGFGTFLVGERAARVGRNPKTGEALQIKASKSPKFRPGKSLKDALVVKVEEKAKKAPAKAKKA